MSWEDPVVQEVRAARNAYAAQFDYDLERMSADIRRKEEQDPRPKIELPSCSRRNPETELPKKSGAA
jgi:hypothetical protein